MGAMQILMSREDFARWLVASQVPMFHEPYEIVVCTCGDMNCHGWRLVAPAKGR